MRLGIAGGYGMNGTGLHGETSLIPFVYLDPVAELGVVATPHIRVAQLPLFPLVSRLPGELCSAEVIAGEITVRCLNDEGRPAPAALPLDEVAKRLSVPRQCLTIQDALGVHALDSLSQQWTSVMNRCVGVPKTQKAPVTLAFERSEGGSGCAPDPIWALVTLSIPSIGIKKRLGHIWNFPLCNATRTTSPEGIQVDCSDSNQSKTQIYAYRNTVFYRIAETDEEASNGVGLAMQQVELPCGMLPDFRFRSYIPIDHGLAR
ncbi:MAG: hypothetical protein QM784_30390 [Polyangiaceae bacterium]